MTYHSKYWRCGVQHSKAPGGLYVSVRGLADGGDVVRSLGIGGCDQRVVMEQPGDEPVSEEEVVRLLLAGSPSRTDSNVVK